MKRIVLSVLLLFSPILLFSVSVTSSSLDNPFPREKVYETDFTQTDEDDESWQNSTIYLATISPTFPVYAFFGHSGIVIENPAFSARFFDYGIFSFSPSFYKDFIKGRLYYKVVRSARSSRYNDFSTQGRSISELKLELTPEQMKGVSDFLLENTKEENSTYLYHYYIDNCATRIRDIYDAATGGAFKAWSEGIETGKTYRKIASRYLSHSVFFSFVLNFLQGPYVDKKLNLWDASFIPDILENSIERYQGTKATLYNEAETEWKVPSSYSLLPLSIAFSIGLALITALSSCKCRVLKVSMNLLLGLIYLFIFILSAVLFYMMFFSSHDVTYWNINILLFSPLVIILSIKKFLSMGKKERDTAVLSGGFLALTILCLIIQLLTPFHQANAAFYLMALSLYGSDFFLIKRSSFNFT